MINLQAAYLPQEYKLEDGADLARIVYELGGRQESRIGETRELLSANLNLGSKDILYRPGMVRRLGMVEILQFWSGYFDERHIFKAVPSLQYPYGIDNAYGIKVAQQLPRVIQQLKENPESRRAIIHIGKAEDGAEAVKPCMQSIQFQIRSGWLFMDIFARSWDAISGVPYDVILMAGVNQIMAKLLKVKPGMVNFSASSLHVYTEAWERVFGKYPEKKTAPWNSIEVIKDFQDFDEVRNWAFDELNLMDYWQKGLPKGIKSYAS